MPARAHSARKAHPGDANFDNFDTTELRRAVALRARAFLSASPSQSRRIAVQAASLFPSRSSRLPLNPLHTLRKGYLKRKKDAFSATPHKESYSTWTTWTRSKKW